MKFKNLVMASALLLLAGSVNATVIECADEVKGSSITTAGTTVTATVSNVNCGPWAGNDNNDLTAATGGYGYGDWMLLDKEVADADDVLLQPGALSVTSIGDLSGTFSFSSLVDYESYLIVLKFDGVFSSFLSDSVADGWGFNTDLDGNGAHELSHLTVYVRNPSEVPEPALVGLLAIGLLGMVVARRKKTV